MKKFSVSLLLVAFALPILAADTTNETKVVNPAPAVGTNQTSCSKPVSKHSLLKAKAIKPAPSKNN